MLGGGWGGWQQHGEQALGRLEAYSRDGREFLRRNSEGKGYSKAVEDRSGSNRADAGEGLEEVETVVGVGEGPPTVGGGWPLSAEGCRIRSSQVVSTVDNELVSVWDRSTSEVDNTLSLRFDELGPVCLWSNRAIDKASVSCCSRRIKLSDKEGVGEDRGGSDKGVLTIESAVVDGGVEIGDCFALVSEDPFGGGDEDVTAVGLTEVGDCIGDGGEGEVGLEVVFGRG